MVVVSYPLRFRAITSLIIVMVVFGWVVSGGLEAKTGGVPAAATTALSAAGIPPPEEADEDRDTAHQEDAAAPAGTTEPSPAEPKQSPASAPTSGPTSRPAKGLTPRVELYLPSMSGLVDAARRSKSASLYQGLSGLFRMPEKETDEDFDFGAVLAILEHIAGWPDTSVAVTTYSQDRDGRARWALLVDWPLSEATERVTNLLALEATQRVVKDLQLTKQPDGGVRLELPDLVLAVLRESEGGTMIASSAELEPPREVFGRESDAAAGQKQKKTPALLYCRLNLGEEEESGGSSPFAMISGIKDIRYIVTLNAQGLWSERVSVRWNPLLGMALKAAFKKLKQPFDCPREAYVAAAFNAAFAEGVADSLAGLPEGTIGARAGGNMAFAAVPGTGFLPFPALYYQFRVDARGKIIESIREAIEKDTRQREEEDQPPAWQELEVEGQPVFWNNPAADGSFGLMPATYRTVIFFAADPTIPQDRTPTTAAAEENRAMLIIAQTPTWADDCVRHWQSLTLSQKSRVRIPDTNQAHWQARINWYKVFDLLHPYLSMAAGLSPEGTAPPRAEELKDVLRDAVVDLRIDYGGLQVRHVGPVPFGAVYVPVVTATSLESTADAGSEAAREQTACRHLRVLHHHAKLFKKDYGRWPATVAELDGYVDFSMHADLLKLQPREQGFAAGLVSMITVRPDRPVRGVEEGETKIDDTLYVIDWSPDAWRLRIRDGEFTNYQTIAIDAEGTLHRIPKAPAAAATERPPVADPEAGNSPESSPDEKKTPPPTDRRKKAA